MLKFWKKKPADGEPAPDAANAPADAASVTAQAPAAPAELAPQTPPETSPDADAPDGTEPVKRSWREQLAGSGFARSLGSLFVRHPRLDDGEESRAA